MSGITGHLSSPANATLVSAVSEEIKTSGMDKSVADESRYNVPEAGFQSKSGVHSNLAPTTSASRIGLQRPWTLVEEPTGFTWVAEWFRPAASTGDNYNAIEARSLVSGLSGADEMPELVDVEDDSDEANLDKDDLARATTSAAMFQSTRPWKAVDEPNGVVWITECFRETSLAGDNQKAPRVYSVAFDEDEVPELVDLDGESDDGDEDFDSTVTPAYGGKDAPGSFGKNVEEFCQYLVGLADGKVSEIA